MSGEVDKAAWRAFLSELLDEDKEGNPNRKMAPLARKLDVAEKTVERWFDPDWQGTVSEASVRKVAEKTGRNPTELLVRIGYISAEDLPYPLEDAWIIEVINASKVLDKKTKRKMIAVQLAQAQREREAHRQRVIDALASTETLANGSDQPSGSPTRNGTKIKK